MAHPSLDAESAARGARAGAAPASREGKADFERRTVGLCPTPPHATGIGEAQGSEKGAGVLGAAAKGSRLPCPGLLVLPLDHPRPDSE